MNTKKTVRAMGAGIQIMLLVVATISFAYFLSEGFALVAALNLTSEQLEALQAQFPGASEQEINNNVNMLLEGGYITEADIDNPQAIADANQEFFTNYNAVIDSVFASGSSINPTDGIFGLFGGFFPSPVAIPGLDVLNGLLDTTGGIQVCTETTEGDLCQPMTGKECNDGLCAGECVEGALADLQRDHECAIGICYDENEGTCHLRSPQGECKDLNGTWYDNPFPSVCEKGCCTLGDQPQFITKRQCEKQSESFGLETVEFSPGGTEPECLLSIYEHEQGACVTPLGDGSGKNNCVFTTRMYCEATNGMFHKDTLCSNPGLNTPCEKQVITGCFDGLDEIYWFDSCNNRENIYDADRDASYHGGMVLAKEESCVLGDANNPVKNQKICGNCERFRSSFCSEKTDTQMLNDEDQNFVCLDMGCYDAQGNRIREHGESWCAYQSSIGLPGPDIGAIDLLRGFIPPNPIVDIVAGERSSDMPGSRHFRKSCLNGNVVTEPCGNYRNEICVEDRDTGDGEFSQASCRINRWQECLAYNPGMLESQAIGMAGSAAGQILDIKSKGTCGLDPDCFVKTVDLTSGVSDTFKFSYCTPRYAPGFDLRGEGLQAASHICSQANNECTVVYVKKLSGWECEANCKCEDPDFAKQLNDLCVSLGDCGFSTNYIGALPGGPGYIVSEGENSLLSGLGGGIGGIIGLISGMGGMQGLNPGLLLDHVAIPGEYIPSNSEVIGGVRGNWLTDLFQGFGGGLEGFFGSDNDENNDIDIPDPGGDAASSGIKVGLITGGTGAGIAALSAAGAFGTTVVTGGTGSLFVVSWPAFSGFGSALMGAGVGMAITGFLIDVLGIGPGLDAWQVYTLIGTGTVSGALIGLGIWVEGALSGACTIPIACIMAIAVTVVIVFLKIFGIGDVDEKKIKFECSAWVPPIGGNCESCGNDILSDGTNSFPCNKYACETLGQNCEYVDSSETPEGGICITTSTSDTSPPGIINFKILTNGFDAEATNTGYAIKKEIGSNECLDKFESVRFEFELNEFGRCRITGRANIESFEQMLAISGGLSKTHQYTFSSLHVDTLGIENFDPDSTNEVTLFLACQDYQGNNNALSPYTVELCVLPTDLTAPIVDIISGVVPTLPFGTEEQEIIVETNEPAECRWDPEDIPFDNMANVMECNDFLQCSTDIPLIDGMAEVCIKCQDTEGNTNTQCAEGGIIILETSESELLIWSIKPNNETITGGGNTGVAALVLEAVTSGGADGSATCYYEIDGAGKDLFYQTGGNTHAQPLSLTAGVHVAVVACEDFVGNSVEGTTTFTVKIDREIPSVTRVYDDAGTLFIITDQPSTCAYSFMTCTFLVDNGERIGIVSGSDGLTHSTEFEAEKTYYIKCKDEFENELSNACNIIVTGGLFNV